MGALRVAPAMLAVAMLAFGGDCLSLIAVAHPTSEDCCVGGQCTRPQKSSDCDAKCPSPFRHYQLGDRIHPDPPALTECGEVEPAGVSTGRTGHTLPLFAALWPPGAGAVLLLPLRI